MLLLMSQAMGSSAQPTEQEVKAAVAQLEKDPNLGSLKKSHRLRWKKSNEPARKDAGPGKGGDWLGWLAAALSWLASTARALLWVIGILLAGILGLYIKRFLEIGGGRPAALRIVMPTHVSDLDIRPGSLPDDIGASSLAIWERGEHRQALALLYRGALSRLAHVHGVPIQDSSTEGDCVRLANSHLQAGPAAYVTRLIRVWQRAVYGGAQPTDEEIRSLCTEFAEAMDHPAQAATEQAA
jgi:hypothetical protein